MVSCKASAALAVVVFLVSCNGLFIQNGVDGGPQGDPESKDGPGSDNQDGPAAASSADKAPDINFSIEETKVIRKNKVWSIIPTNSGGDISKCEITSNNKPAWMSISNTTCEISGTPTTTTDATDYQITARNSAGKSTDTISLRVRSSGSSSDPTIAARSIISGRGHSCMIMNDKTVKCWGANYASQMGDGTATERDTPVSVLIGTSPDVKLRDVEELSVSTYSTCARLADRTVKCWGGNSEGQLGDNSTTERAAAVAVLTNETDPLTDIELLGGGSGYNTSHFAVNSSGALYSWGNNDYGQLGIGSTTGASVATTVEGLDGTTDATTVSVIDSDGFPIPPFFGGDPAHMVTCAGMVDGTFKCWGLNYHGQFGNGATSTDNATEPVTIDGVTGVTDVCIGSYHTCIVVSGGVRCAGKNDLGQLGDGTTTASTSFVTAIAENSGVERVTCGFRKSCVRYSHGGVKCWGDSIFGELGDGNAATTESAANSEPRDVVLGSGVKAYRLSGGINQACAVIDTDKAKCWGSNGNGQLGNDSTTHAGTPVEVQF